MKKSLESEGDTLQPDIYLDIPLFNEQLEDVMNNNLDKGKEVLDEFADKAEELIGKGKDVAGDVADKIDEADIDGKWKDTVAKAPEKVQPLIKYGVPAVLIVFVIIPGIIWILSKL